MIFRIVINSPTFNPLLLSSFFSVRTYVITIQLVVIKKKGKKYYSEKCQHKRMTPTRSLRPSQSPGWIWRYL